MRADFESAYQKYLDGFASSISEEQRIAYKRYAIGNRDRGEDAVLALTSLIGRGVEGLSCLDVGSGYGGLLLALAKRGASAMGVEYAKDLYKLSKVNIADEPYSIPIYQGNFLDIDVLPNGMKFDLVVVNDVFEHIHDIEYLFRRLQDVSHENTVLYFEIPNYRSYHAIRKEHHKFIFGLTLLEPGSWADMIGPFNIYHRPLSLYRLLFKSIGYETLTLNTLVGVSSGAEQRIRLAHEEIDLELDLAPFKGEQLRVQARSNFDRMRSYFEADVLKCKESDLFVNYEMYVWSGIVTRTGSSPMNEYIEFAL